LTQIKQATGAKLTLSAMARIDWLFVLSVIATLALSAGGVSVLLFAM
jgi:hypothetical protein